MFAFYMLFIATCIYKYEHIDLLQKVKEQTFLPDPSKVDFITVREYMDLKLCILFLNIIL